MYGIIPPYTYILESVFPFEALVDRLAVLHLILEAVSVVISTRQRSFLDRFFFFRQIVLPFLFLHLLFFLFHVFKENDYRIIRVEYRDQPWFSVFKHSMDHEEGV